MGTVADGRPGCINRVEGVGLHKAESNVSVRFARGYELKLTILGQGRGGRECNRMFYINRSKW